MNIATLQSLQASDLEDGGSISLVIYLEYTHRERRKSKYMYSVFALLYGQLVQ